jgi:hypothetical protein
MQSHHQVDKNLSCALEKLYVQKDQALEQLRDRQKGLSKSHKKIVNLWQRFEDIAQNIKILEQKIELVGEPQDFDYQGYEIIQQQIEKQRAQIQANENFNSLSIEFDELKGLWGRAEDVFSKKLYLDLKIRQQHSPNYRSFTVQVLEIEAELKQMTNRQDPELPGLKTRKNHLERLAYREQLIVLEQQMQQQQEEIRQLDWQIMKCLNAQICYRLLNEIAISAPDLEYLESCKISYLSNALNKTTAIVRYFATTEQQIAGQVFAKTLKVAHEFIAQLCGSYPIQELIFCGQMYMAIEYNDGLRFSSKTNDLRLFAQVNNLHISQHLCLLASFCSLYYKPEFNDEDLSQTSKFVFDVLDRQLCYFVTRELLTIKYVPEKEQNASVMKEFLFAKAKKTLFIECFNKHLNHNLLALVAQCNTVQNIWIGLNKEHIELLFVRKGHLGIQFTRKLSDVAADSLLAYLAKDASVLSDFNDAPVNVFNICEKLVSQAIGDVESLAKVII